MTYTITSQDQELVNISLYDRFRGIRMSGNQIFHVGVTKGSSHRQDAVDAVIKNQSSGIGDTSTLVLITTFVVIGEPESLSVPAQDNSCIADICGIEDPLT